MPWRVGGSAANPKLKDFPCYLVLWEGYPAEEATWEYPVERGRPGGIPLQVVAEYEAQLDAEEALEAEEDAEIMEEEEEGAQVDDNMVDVDTADACAAIACDSEPAAAS